MQSIFSSMPRLSLSDELEGSFGDFMVHFISQVIYTRCFQPHSQHISFYILIL